MRLTVVSAQFRINGFPVIITSVTQHFQTRFLFRQSSMLSCHDLSFETFFKFHGVFFLIKLEHWALSDVQKSQLGLVVCFALIQTIEHCRKNSFGGKIQSRGFSGSGNSFARGWKARGNFPRPTSGFLINIYEPIDPLDFTRGSSVNRSLTSSDLRFLMIYATHHSIVIIIIVIAVIVATVIEVVDRCQRRIIFHRIRVHKCIVYQWIIQSHCQICFWFVSCGAQSSTNNEEKTIFHFPKVKIFKILIIRSQSLRRISSFPIFSRHNRFSFTREFLLFSIIFLGRYFQFLNVHFSKTIFTAWMFTSNETEFVIVTSLLYKHLFGSCFAQFSPETEERIDWMCEWNTYLDISNIPRISNSLRHGFDALSQRMRFSENPIKKLMSSFLQQPMENHPTRQICIIHSDTWFFCCCDVLLRCVISYSSWDLLIF